MTIAVACVAIQIAYDLRYVGPQVLGNTYDPAMLPSCEKQLTKARAIARLAGGRGMEVLTHGMIQTYPAKENAVKNL